MVQMPMSLVRMHAVTMNLLVVLTFTGWFFVDFNVYSDFTYSQNGVWGNLDSMFWQQIVPGTGCVGRIGQYANAGVLVIMCVFFSSPNQRHINMRQILTKPKRGSERLLQDK